MRVKLALLPRCRAGRDDAQLAGTQIYIGPREDLAVAIDDHPFVEGRVQLADIPAQLFVHLAVDYPTRLFAALAPKLDVVDRRIIVVGRSPTLRDRSPRPRGVQSARETGEQVRLENYLFHRDGIDFIYGF